LPPAPTPHPKGSSPRGSSPPKQRRLSPASPTSSWFHLSYLIDWGLALAIGATGYFGIRQIEPTHRTWNDPQDPSLSYPLKPDTVDNYLNFGLALGIPLAAFGTAQIFLQSGHDFHHAALGLVEAMGLTLFLTELIKVTAGRLRPDWFARCQPNAQKECTAEDSSELRNGRKSFPSGHTSVAFAGATYLTLYLWGKLRPLSGRGQLWEIPLLLAPMVGALLVGISRTFDNRHHWEDVLGGALLGMGCAYLGYRLNFPSLFSKNSGRPYRRTSWSIAPLLSSQGTGLALSGSF